MNTNAIMHTKSRISMVFFDNLKNEPEPYSEIPLENCTIEQVQVKIEFFENTNSGLKNECEALEMFLVKISPEYAENLTDVSWLPYDIKPKKAQIDQETSLKNPHSSFKRRMSVVPDITGSIYHITRKIHLTKLTTKHKIPVLTNVLDSMDMDYDKRYRELLKESKKMNNIKENLEARHHEIIKDVENYKSVILLSGYDKLTKRIPGEKYIRFAKKRLIIADLKLSKFRVQLSTAISKLRELRQKYTSLQEIRDNISVADCMILEASNRQLVNILANIDAVLVNMKNYNKKSRQKYLVEKSNVETYEKTFNEGLALIKQKKNSINQLSKIISDFSPKDEEKQKSAEATESKKTLVAISEPLPAADWRNQGS